MDKGHLSAASNVIAPDGSEIRLAGNVRGGSMVECTLAPGRTSVAVRHRSVEELWLVVEGQGDVWRKTEGGESVTTVGRGTWLTIPLGTRFQFRNTGTAPLRIVIATIPPWPGEGEAVRVEGYWPPA